MATKVLPQSELEIMKVMWALNRPVSAAELNNTLGKGWRVQTLITHLARMEEKGVVLCRRGPSINGVRCFYEVVQDKDAYMRREVTHFLERIRSISDEPLSRILEQYGTDAE